MLVIGALAAVLGIKQSAWELGQNTYQFLLHRPVPRWYVLGTKLLVGCGLVFVVGGLAIFAYALWAASPGNSPTPFFWSMIADEWQMVFCAMLVYLGSVPQRNPPRPLVRHTVGPIIHRRGRTCTRFYFLTWWCAAIVLLVVATIYLAGIGVLRGGARLLAATGWQVKPVGRPNRSLEQ